jgi:hypothetical protein
MAVEAVLVQLLMDSVLLLVQFMMFFGKIY